MIRFEPTLSEIEQTAAALEGRSAQEILRWALDRYGLRMALACSFGGPSGMVLLDMLMALEPRVPVFYLDTGVLFPETYDLAAVAERRYGITPRAVRPSLSLARQASLHGEALWSRDPDRCCQIRKVLPQREFLRGYDAWITGIRRDQTSTRRATPVVAWDEQFGLAKIAPLVGWSEQDIWDYIRVHDVPYNALHDRGYPSIGCTHCTRAVLPGEDLRAGRWSGAGKIECGLHRRPETKIAV
ncbi:MAG TPA: phosphoadenylyl-sulfate reductase [Chloroflexota bacterium]|jgi:phosphoadenosine phosphosulfate reductase|nr:phosphoadenylyl-sulfate reductase [Chloroflexota bacterium]